MLIDPTDSWVRSAFVPVFPVYWSSTTRGILSWTDGYAAVIYSLRPTKNVHLRFKICPPAISTPSVPQEEPSSSCSLSEMAGSGWARKKG